MQQYANKEDTGSKFPPTQRRAKWHEATFTRPSMRQARYAHQACNGFSIDCLPLPPINQQLIHTKNVCGWQRPCWTHLASHMFFRPGILRPCFHCKSEQHKWMNWCNLYGWMDGWMHEWMHGWMYNWMDELISESMYKWTNERASEWMSERLKEWMNGIGALERGSGDYP